MRGAFAIALAGCAAVHGGVAYADEALHPLVPAIVEYRWHPLVPHWVVDPEITRARASPEWGVASLRYALPDFRFASRRIGVLPHFECKYIDFWLPNACTTRWVGVYADVPVAVVQRGTVDVDVPRVQSPGAEAVVDVPRLVWKEETLVVSVPAFVAACPDAPVDRSERCVR